MSICGLFFPKRGSGGGGGAAAGGGSGFTDNAHYGITGTPGKGSSNTNIVRFPNAVDSSANMTDSAENGTYYTAPADGFVTASASFVTSASSVVGFKKNQTLNNTTAASNTDWVNGYREITGSIGDNIAVPRFRVAAGDKIWFVCTSGVVNLPKLFNFRVSFEPS